MHDGLGLTGGDVNQQVIEYFAARAKGGVGLIINGFTVVCPDELCGTAGAGQSHLTTLDNRNSFQLFAERLHEYDCKLFVQLHHPGRSVYAPQFLNGGRQPVSSTAMPASMKGDSHAAPARELTVPEIKQIVKCYAIAAQGAYTAGCDGVEVHCAHGYLFSQFINPFKNERKDEYGGSLENCCRIATETLDAIRKVVPKNFPVSVRINGAEGDFRPNGKEWDMNYMKGVAKLLVEHGADMVNVSIGGMDCMPNPDMRARYRDDIIKNIKEVVDVPIAAVNCLKTPEEAEGMLVDGIADMAILGRQLICDPEWANKARTGREEDIRPCLSCNNCIHHSSLMQPVRCAINPLAGREAEDNTLVPGTGNAVVIGAGPAGIEAALTLAAKGIYAMLGNTDNVMDHCFGGRGKAKPMKRPMAMLVMIPTTSGTGSEVSTGAVITDDEINYKATGLQILPNVALLDPKLDVTMPFDLTAHTAFDALTHAIESYLVGGLAHKVKPLMNFNPLTDTMGLKAARLIYASLPTVLEHPDDVDARAKAKYGAMLAGIGMCPGGLTLGHGIGQLFGAQWHIPHGLGCALGLVPAIRQGVKVEHNDRERYARLAYNLGCKVLDDDDTAAIAEQIAQAIEKLMTVAKIPTVRELGHTADEISALVEAGMKDPLNFVSVTADELRGHLEYLFNK